jgi:SAM-dependent methyltransferase
MTAASNVEWKTYGDLDYGASHDYARGLQEWALLREHLRQYGLAGHDAALEVGCGGGRLTNAVAQDFATVHACDVAPARLEQVRQIPNAAKVVTHLLTSPILPVEAATVDLCFSTHVMQHISDARVVDRYFAECFRVLRPGGVACIHVPVIGAHHFTGTLGETLKWYGKNAVKAAVLPVTRLLMRGGVKRLPWRIDYYRRFSYAQLLPYLKSLGFADVQLRILDWDDVHSYVFARKPV